MNFETYFLKCLKFAYITFLLFIQFLINSFDEIEYQISETNFYITIDEFFCCLSSFVKFN